LKGILGIVRGNHLVGLHDVVGVVGVVVHDVVMVGVVRVCGECVGLGSEVKLKLNSGAVAPHTGTGQTWSNFRSAFVTGVMVNLLVSFDRNRIRL
jgi:hypothetical protein